MTTKEAYKQAAEFFADSVAKVKPGQWDDPALGIWSVRDLVGHTSRSITRIEEFAGKHADKIDVESAARHYHISLAPQGVHEAIARAGHAAGVDLGDNPAASVRDALDRVLTIVDSTADDAVIAYTNGGILFEEYLKSRVLELVVHTLDLLAAVNTVEQPPREALSCALHLLADLAVESGYGGQFALLATGRGVLPDKFSVLG